MTQPEPSPARLAAMLPATSFALRGYNVVNLGRTPELLADRRYGPVVESYLRRASAICGEVTQKRVDLVDRVRRQEETDLSVYAEAVALIVAVELAQLEILSTQYGIELSRAGMFMGYSLGELAAASACGMMEMEEVLRIPLELSDDCVALAHDATLGVLFCRNCELPLDAVRRLCLHLNAEGRGVVGISTYLSPNSVLLIGQGDTLDRFRARMRETLPAEVALRKNEHRWPPLHTPIVWEKHIPNRAAVGMHTLQGGFTAPQPPIFSLVTGQMSYNDFNARELFCRWTDHPQRLWDGIYATLSTGIELVVHVGPEPNLLPATFKRLSDNVEIQRRASLGLRAVSGLVTRPWLARLLPARTALLRAPLVKHLILEDWLLAQPDSAASATGATLPNA